MATGAMVRHGSLVKKRGATLVQVTLSVDTKEAWGRCRGNVRKLHSTVFQLRLVIVF